MDIRATVFEALNNAKENGYDMSDYTIDDIVNDLVVYDADLEDVATADIRPHVEAWLRRKE